MPAAIDRATFLKAITWSIEYLLDEKRGQGKSLPTDSELKIAFPESDITNGQISEWIFSKFGTNDLAKITSDQQKTRGVLDEIAKELETPKGSAVPKFTKEDLAAAAAARGKPSALGVLAELEAIEPLLREHNQETTIQLTQSIKPQVQTLISELGIKNLPAEQIDTISFEIAREIARDTLENMPRIVDLAQTQDVVTDAIIQTLIADPVVGPVVSKSFPAKNPDKTLPPEIQFNEEKLIQKITPVSSQITKSFSVQLEKSAVLGSLVQIAQLKKPSLEVLDNISVNVQKTVDLNAPLTSPGNQQAAKASLGTYLVTYLETINSELPAITSTSIPSFDKLQKIKEVAHNRATAKIGTTISQTKIAKQLGTQIGFANLTAPLAVALKLAPLKVLPQRSYNLPPGAGLIFSSDKNLSDAHLALLAHDQGWLNKELKKAAQAVEGSKKKKSLTYQERKIYLASAIKLAKLQKAQELTAKKPKRALAFRNIFRNRLELLRATYSAQSFWEYRLDYFRPKTITFSPRFGPRYAFASIAPGSLSLFGKINPGFRFSIPKIGPPAGMGISPAGIAGGIVTAPAVGLLRKLRNMTGALFGGLALYFLALGKAVFMGFLIGAGIGGTAGAIIGAALPVILLGPPGLLLLPITIPLGAFIGGSIGGTIGGLIAYGLYTGSATAVSTGVGAGIGAIVGGATGAVVGAAVVGWIPFIGPFLAPFGAILGAAVGAYVGAAIGGTLGYLFGHYVIGTLGVPATGALAGAAIGFYLGGPLGAAIGAGIGWLATGGWVQVKNFFAGTPSAVSTAGAGFFSAAGSFITGLASTVWGGITTAGGISISFLSGAGNFLLNLAGLSPSAAAAAVPVAGAAGAVVVGSTIVGIVTASTFFNLEADLPTAIAPPGENQFFSVTKSATPNRIADNNDLPQDITFTITLKAKANNLTNLQITDELKVQGKNANFNVTQDKDGKPISPPCADIIRATLAANDTWSCQFTITATAPPEEDFRDSVVANTVTVTATPEGASPITANTTATVVIGNPPTICAIIERQGPWSSAENDNIDAICQDLDRSPQVVSLLQKAGTIYLIRIPDGKLGTGVCGTVNGGNRISIACDMTPTTFAKYVIIHEMGHVLGNYNTGVYNSLIGVFKLEGLIPTYPCDAWLTNPTKDECNANFFASESFAEMIGNYVVFKIYNFQPRAWSGYPGGPWVNPGPGWTTFQNDWPAHYNFAKTEIFGGVEY